MKHLKAVNNLLKMIGTRKVTSVDIQHPDVIDAVDALEDWKEKLLKRGWWFNRMASVTMTPNSQGFIVFATNVIRYEYSNPRQKQVYPLLAKRDNRLLNVEQNTFTFTQSLVLDLYIDLDWNDLPDAAQQYIVYRAGADLVRDKIEDTVKVNDLKGDAQEQMNELDAEELRTAQYNMFDNPATARVRAGRQPFGGRRGRSIIPTVD